MKSCLVCARHALSSTLSSLLLTCCPTTAAGEQNSWRRHRAASRSAAQSRPRLCQLKTEVPRNIAGARPAHRRSNTPARGRRGTGRAAGAGLAAARDASSELSRRALASTPTDALSRRRRGCDVGRPRARDRRRRRDHGERAEEQEEQRLRKAAPAEEAPGRHAAADRRAPRVESLMFPSTDGTRMTWRNYFIVA